MELEQEHETVSEETVPMSIQVILLKVTNVPLMIIRLSMIGVNGVVMFCVELGLKREQEIV